MLNKHETTVVKSLKYTSFFSLLLTRSHNLFCALRHFQSCRCHSCETQIPLFTAPSCHYPTCTLFCGSFSSLSAALCRSSATTGELKVLTETPCSDCSSTPAPSTDPSCGLAKGSWTKRVLVRHSGPLWEIR